jgi:glycosyltransferase involved in cell wall biosynthesis
MKPLVSVVVPAYNCEKYIKKCLNSILNQTIQDWECIIVNDGSTDDSLSVIEKFVSQDDRFSYLTIPNSGYGKTPRDTGISLAKSDWILAVDADDYIDMDTLQKLLDRSTETNADIVYLRLVLFDNDTNNYLHSIPAENFDMSQIISGEEAAMLTIPRWIINGNGLIKRVLWSTLPTFNTGINHVGSDGYDTRAMQLRANKIAFVDTAYHYRSHSNSVVHRLNLKTFELLKNEKMLEELIQKHFGINSSQAKITSCYRMDGVLEKQILLFRKSKLFSKKDREKAQKLIKEYWLDIDKTHLFENNKLKRILLAKRYTLFVVSVFTRCVLASIYHLIKQK